MELSDFGKSLMTELGLSESTEDKTFQKFTPTEIMHIQRCYLTQTDKQIGDTLGRNKFSIREKRKSLNLAKYKVINASEIRIQHAINRDKNWIENEIKALVHFIETTKSDVWRDIANTYRKQLIKKLKT